MTLPRHKAEVFLKAVKFSTEYINRKASIANTNRQQASQFNQKVNCLDYAMLPRMSVSVYKVLYLFSS